MVSNFYCKLRIQGTYDVVKVSLWKSYTPSGELGLYLSELNFGGPSELVEEKEHVVSHSKRKE